MKVEIGGDVPVIAKTVADLFSLSAWPPGLILNFPSCGDRYPESVVVVERASCVRQLTEIRRHRVATRPDRQRLFASGALRQAD